MGTRRITYVHITVTKVYLGSGYLVTWYTKHPDTKALDLRPSYDELLHLKYFRAGKRERRCSGIGVHRGSQGAEYRLNLQYLLSVQTVRTYDCRI